MPAVQTMANAQTTRTADGGPYRRKIVSFEEKPASSFQEEFNSRLRRSGMEKGGVRVSQITEDQRDLIPVYDPDHPDANEEGYVMMPNVDLVKETVDGMAATRSYEANITAFNAIKMMSQKALEIGK